MDRERYRVSCLAPWCGRSSPAVKSRSQSFADLSKTPLVGTQPRLIVQAPKRRADQHVGPPTQHGGECNGESACGRLRRADLAVNPRRTTVAGREAWPGVANLPAAPDLAVVCTPPVVIPDLISQLGERGTRGGSSSLLWPPICLRWTAGALHCDHGAGSILPSASAPGASEISSASSAKSWASIAACMTSLHGNARPLRATLGIPGARRAPSAPAQ